MAEYYIYKNGSKFFDHYTFLGTVRKVRKELEDQGNTIMIKRHYCNGNRVVYETGKIDKVFGKKS